ncbi:hypothetical protein CF64_14670 [Bradyrhizobium japonicum]|nr:hypothetical protein CF64_14670 [Bradyrhizobium japonicum]
MATTAIGAGAAATGVGIAGAGTATTGKLGTSQALNGDRARGPRFDSELADATSGVQNENGRAGFRRAAISQYEKVRSDRAAAATPPTEAVRADAGAGHDDDRRGNHHGGGSHNDRTAHRTAAAIGATVPAGAAATSGAGRLAETDDRAGEHDGGKQVFHMIFLLVLGQVFRADS